MNGQEYDIFPYEGRPQAKTHPQHARAVARMFGLASPDVRRARVLELGCASGANLIPMACSYPEARFVGIDYSRVQIDAGKRVVSALGLENLDLREASILDIDGSWGKFDYIICHGVFSWVPELVRDKILSVCRDNLTPDGVAVVSYNTLPGWNFARSAREMMLYHTRTASTPAARVGEARKFMRFLAPSATRLDPAYGRVLEDELALMSASGDAYVLHEYLESENIAFYFHEFADHARRHGLAYLGETAISTMYPGNFPPEVAVMLESGTDGIAVEQYMDFFRNRRFRMTLLVHADRMPDRTVHGAAIESLFLRCLLTRSEVFTDTDGRQKLKFEGPPDITAETPVQAALLSTLLECSANKAISTEELYRRTQARLPGTSLEEIRREFIAIGMLLVLSGALQPMTDPGVFVTTVSERPVACPLVRWQAGQPGTTWVSNRRHDAVPADAAGLRLLTLLDGTRDVDAVIRALGSNISREQIDRHLSLAAAAALLVG